MTAQAAGVRSYLFPSLTHMLMFFPGSLSLRGSQLCLHVVCVSRLAHSCKSQYRRVETRNDMAEKQIHFSGVTIPRKCALQLETRQQSDRGGVCGCPSEPW
ncbi:hypothetical protein B0T09DRAFT_134850 [Sordaria sp. MPI-SDFR-AT-0083]|nr:hypothetical protein B0T09DRAFT_134850 [Sordaria sp. MPI-SDFR-AT-0083]